MIVEPTDVVNIEVPKNNLLDFLKGTEYDYLFTEQADKTAKDLKNRFKIFKDEDVEVRADEVVTHAVVTRERWCTPSVHFSHPFTSPFR